ncbi:response regulator MprA [Oxobacter pfennigii]|uniref:Stage 0 sporulation protein A homolog n=1 Tax=Oxobacter pfennigii TaxID=36849 RepID=A0A0P9ALA9_9CLOT|nr:response regulator transcription factor [Oxobacter pfennigii]KPU46149.1 response regulator MprA [Oxobacter pfennigii]
MRLLLVEDEKRLSDALVYILKKHKYLVDAAYDGEDGEDMACTEIYDLIILDRMLPKKEGIDILRNIRSRGIKTPVLFLTARDTIENRVEGLDAGADDYLVKPFSTEELLARVRALSRRQGEILMDKSLHIGNVTLDPSHCEASIGEKISIKLTLKECQLLELLMKNKGRVITKEQILDRVWGFDIDANFNNVEIYVHYLRKKLDDGAATIRIATIRGIGYSLEEKSNV